VPDGGTEADVFTDPAGQSTTEQQRPMGAIMKPFITEEFLLENRTAVKLFKGYAEGQPIIDYHCHLPAEEIARNINFADLTQVWLAGDHYKWRAMRTCGVPERYITGDASGWEKFEKWAEIVPRTVRNPLYHWTHMELRRPFGITDRLLSRETARGIWDQCNGLLKTPEFTTQGIIRQMNVEVICTTDDPIDSLEHHETFARTGGRKFKMLPAFRPDKAMAVEQPKPWREYVRRLEAAVDMTIATFDDFLGALRKRHDFFHRHGCRLSDHGLERIYADEYTLPELNSIFEKLLQGRELGGADVNKFKSAMLFEFALMDWEKGWVQQFHLGALRNNNTRMMRAIGPDTGYDSIGDWEVARELGRFLDRLDSEDRLAKTILYNLNPAQNEVLATMIGNFQGGTVPGKLQYGSAWWFLDQKDGMTKQIEALSNMGLLSQFVGMLTDSRSFLSYPRHEYFRRLLCNILGTEMEKGLIPDDLDLVGGIVRDICYFNARRYFGFLET
jgi:glucuronate isomerase